MGTHSPDRHELVVIESDDGADPDPQPVYELTPSAIIAVCEQAESDAESDSEAGEPARG